jgi:perosamine synthetase
MNRINEPMNEMPLLDVKEGNIVLFHPHITEKVRQLVNETLHTRWIGQGPRVEEFESMFRDTFAPGHAAIAVGSGTDALHLAYVLAGIKPGDEVVVPVFTCTATNIPLLYIGAKLRFADIQRGTLNIDTDHVQRLVNDKTKAIVCVHYGGLPCDMSELQAIAKARGIPIIEDAAQALGATYKGKPVGSISEFTIFSFQAIKHITTGDGGMLTFKDRSLEEKAKRIRWFGIDRSKKQLGVWENDITEVGYKYQMTDIGAAMGLAALEDFSETLAHRRKLLSTYERQLQGAPGVTVIGAGYKDREHAAWLCTAVVEKRTTLQKKLREHGIESNQVHYRNDRYSIFGGRRKDLPNMDEIEDKYLVLPVHTKMTVEDVERVCDIVRSGW